MNFDPFVELAIDGVMVDVSNIGTGRPDGVRITRGQSNEATKVSPGTCEFELNNQDGRFSPRNPLGPYYGKLFRNIGVRVCNRELVDTFTRTVSNAWGATDAGHVWSTSGTGSSITAGNWQVTGTAATLSIAARPGTRRATLSTQNFRDLDVAATFTIPFVVAGGPIELGLTFRDGTIYYLAHLLVDTDQTVDVGLRFEPSGDTIGSDNVAALQYVTGQPMRVRAQVEGNSIRIKAFMVADGEPDTWDYEVHDTSIDTLGIVGVWFGVGSGNSNTLPLTITVDDFEVRSPRFSGELSTLPSRWDTTGASAWVGVEAGGLLRRLSRSDGPVYSPIRRAITLEALDFLPSQSPDFYWPLEDASGFGEGVEWRGISEPWRLLASTDANARDRFGQGRLAPWLPSVLSVSDGDTVGVSALGYETAQFDWYLEYCRTGDINSKETLTVTQVNAFSAGSTWQLAVDATVSPATLTLRFPDASTQSFNAAQLSDGLPHHIRLTVEQDGSDVDYDVDIDGVTVASSTKVSTDLLPISHIRIVGTGTANVPTAIGHVVLNSKFLAPDVADIFTALYGYTGETAGRRIERLCSEGVDETTFADTIPFDYVGDLDETSAMGPQRAASFTALLDECVDADRGLLYEPRSVIGLGYRTRQSLYNTVATLELDYAAGELAPPFEPTDDDQQTVNDVLVKRVDGGSFHAAQTTGALSVANIGIYRTEETINVATDAQLPGLAGWIKHLGTTDEERYPRIGVNRARQVVATDTNLSRQILDLNIGDLFAVTNLTDLNIYGDRTLLMRGYEEVLNLYEHTFVFNTSPASPYQVTGLYPTAGQIGSAQSVLHIGVSDSATTLLVDIGGIGPFDIGVNARPWTEDPDNWPIPITIGGEDMLVTAVTSGASFVSAGTAAHAVNSSVTPGLPAGWQEGDALFILAAIRNTAGAVVLPDGYDELRFTGTHFNIFGKIAEASESAPVITFTGGVANADTSAQMAAVRGITLDWIASERQSNSSAQNIATASAELGSECTDVFIIYYAWKQDDWTSVADIPAGGVGEIGEPDTTLGDDQGIVWDYRIIVGDPPFGTRASQTFTVTGGASAISKGGILVFVPRVQTFTVTRSVNGVVKAHSAGAPITLTNPRVLAM